MPEGKLEHYLVPKLVSCNYDLGVGQGLYTFQYEYQLTKLSRHILHVDTLLTYPDITIY
jgi:hypothetical protein